MMLSVSDGAEQQKNPFQSSGGCSDLKMLFVSKKEILRS